MAFSLKKGSFMIMGARRMAENCVCFTFVVPAVDTKCAVCLYDKKTKALVERVELSEDYRMGLVYSVEISGPAFDKLCYLYELDGVLSMDEYAKSVVGRELFNDQERKENGFCIYAGIEPVAKRWEDKKVRIEPSDMVLYKLHLRGFTKENKSKDAGTFAAFIRRLPYLKELGVTSLVFMPLYDFEEVMYEKRQLLDKKGERHISWEPLDKVNYWGYGKGYFFAPKASYFGVNPIEGMKKMVKAIHENDMEIIMEFTMDGQSCDYVKACLRYYVTNFHIDGFRLIGAKVPALELINDAYLSDVKLIFESVPSEIEDINGVHKHVFVCNDGFMNVLRQMQHGMNGNMVELTNHLKRQSRSHGFVNYASSVSGFTLLDSVSYTAKHNEANGEENRDGTNNNYSVNYGVEGSTRNKGVNAARLLSVRNALVLTILAQAIPGLNSGDECLNSAKGNNNPYSQDNEVGWLNAPKTKDAKALYAFVQGLLTLRREHRAIRSDLPMSISDTKHIGLPDLSYHDKEPWSMCVYDGQKTVGILYAAAYADESEDVFLACNFSYKAERIALPRIPGPGKRWRLVVNTAADAPYIKEGVELSDEHFVDLSAGSVAVLLAVPTAAKTRKTSTVKEK